MLEENLRRIEEKIAEAAIKSGRKREDITLVAVTKKVDVKTAQDLLSLGVKNLGENRVQVLLEKYDVIKNDAIWHLIGHLQTNKVKYIADKVSLIHSVDSLKLLEEINQRAGNVGKIQEVLLEVNISGEESKFGISAREADEFASQMENFKNVKLKGLMTIAPIPLEAGANRKYFCAMKELYENLAQKKYSNVSMEHLSMGMSMDFEDAIVEGANIVRIGTSLFA